MPKPAPSPVQRIEVPADDRRLSEVRDFVTRACEQRGFGGRALANIRLAVDEACTNVVKHAYADGSGTLRVQVAGRRGWLEIRVADQGKPFDGRVEIPHLGQWIDTRRKGGFGVFLMHRLMDEVRYETTPAGNEWILRKRLPRPTSELGRRLRRRYVIRAAVAIVLATAGVATPLAVHEGREHALAGGRTHAAHPDARAGGGRAPRAPRARRAVARADASLRGGPRLRCRRRNASSPSPWWTASTRSGPRIGPLRRSPPSSSRLGSVSPNPEGVRRAFERIDGVSVLHLSVPVRVGSETAELGSVHVSIRWAATEAAIRAATLRVVVIAVAVDALAILLVLAFLAHLLAPIQRLVDGVRALGQGGPEVAVDGPEEIGAIASAFNEIHARYRNAERSAAEHARLQEEMQLAREIQSSILPRSVPEIPGFEIARVYRPAQEVGGDYYDFLDAGPGLTGVVVADVAGKGVPGSIVMSMVRTALRMETRSNAHAGDVLARLHAFVSPDLRRGMFVTMLYLVLDSRNRVVSYASAGHTPMLLYRSRTGEVLVLGPHGIPVGLAGSDADTFERTLDVERLRLHEGDLLLLYTDGITEARNAGGEEYGEDRLADAMRRWGRESAEEFLSRLDAELVEFAGGAGLQDDLTLVAIKERQGAPVVAGEVQQKLFDLVERQGVPAAEACARLHVSPATYYRLKHAATVEPREVRVVAPRVEPHAEGCGERAAVASGGGGAPRRHRRERGSARIGAGLRRRAAPRGARQLGVQRARAAARACDRRGATGRGRSVGGRLREQPRLGAVGLVAGGDPASGRSRPVRSGGADARSAPDARLRTDSPRLPEFGTPRSPRSARATRSRPGTWSPPTRRGLQRPRWRRPQPPRRRRPTPRCRLRISTSSGSRCAFAAVAPACTARSRSSSSPASSIR